MEYIWWFEYQVRHIISKATRPSKCTRENNMHRRAAVSNKLTMWRKQLCRMGSHRSWGADSPPVCIFSVWITYEIWINGNDGSPTVYLFREEVSQHRNHFVIMTEKKDNHRIWVEKIWATPIHLSLRWSASRQFKKMKTKSSTMKSQ
jgi:hypothetical protein